MFCIIKNMRNVVKPLKGKTMNQFIPKLFDVMKGYSKKQFINDVIAGIIVAIIALPLSIALALASGVGQSRVSTQLYLPVLLFHSLAEAGSRLPDQQPHLQPLLLELWHRTEWMVLLLQQLWLV